MRLTFIVKLEWDPEAKVWVATSDDVPGLVAEAETEELLIKKLSVLVPELLEENGVVNDYSKDVPIDLLTQKHIELKARKSV